MARCPDRVSAEQSNEFVGEFVVLGVLNRGHHLLDRFDVGLARLVGDVRCAHDDGR
jgi:hypothetical protein